MICAQRTLGGLLREASYLLLQQPAVDAFAARQLIRRAILNDPARLQDEDTVETAHGRQPMCNGNEI